MDNKKQIPQIYKQNPQTLLDDRAKLELFFFSEDSPRSVRPEQKTVTRFMDHLYDEVGIPKNTSVKQIGIQLEQWYEMLQNTEETTTEIPKYEAATESNTPDEWTRTQQQAELEKRETAKQQADVKGKEQTEKFIEQKIKNLKRINISPKEDLTKVKLTNNDKEKLYNLGVAATTDPGTAQKIIEEKISESLLKSPIEIQKAVTEEIVTKAAVDFVDKTKPFAEYKSYKEIPDEILVVNPASPFTSLTEVDDPSYKNLVKNYQEREIISENAKNVALSIETERRVNSSLTESFLYDSPNISTVLYGPDNITPFTVSTDQQDSNQLSLSPQEILERGEDIKNLWGKFSRNRSFVPIDEAGVVLSSYTPSASTALSARTSSLLLTALPSSTGAIVGFKSSILATQWVKQGAPLLNSSSFAGFLTSGGSQQVASMSSLVSWRSFGFVSTSGKFGIAYGSGITGSAGKIAIGGIKIGSSSLAVATTSTGTKVAASGIFAKIGGFLGSIGPIGGTILGAAIGWVAGKIIDKIDWKKVKNAMPYVGGFLVGGTLLTFFGPLLGVLGGLGTFLALSGVGLAGIGTGALNFFGMIRSVIGVSIGAPAVAAFVSFPLIVALILFIINSGAYIVPPGIRSSTSAGAVVSPYIDIIKTPNPPGPFQNTQLPLVVEYRVEIKAKKGSLSNVKIGYECSVVKRNSNTLCPKTDPVIPTTTQTGISPASPFVFTYRHTYDKNNFQDAFVTDTITVTADVTEATGQQSAGSATIKIGNPPEECPGDMWPTSHGVISQGAYTNDSHKTLEASDISTVSTPVFATHSGVVVTAQKNSCLGNYIEIRSTCNGKSFISRYAHLEGVGVSINRPITMGQKIGLSGNTGTCTTGPHLHYEFKYLPSGNPKWPSMAPYMMKPYTPRDIPRGCVGSQVCGVSF